MRRANPSVIARHPVNELDLTIRIEWDGDTKNWVTYVPELNNISTFGQTELEALDNTAEMIMGFIEASERQGLRLPLSERELAKIRSALAGY
ncbi:MAG: type II toxin-antitoxin system HicB family antitoxin [Bryobacteraceae bacterium]|nr:type II toxin-antitoxin system HicB family antitoxin [Bryobacterales bacterium]MEB2361267.1 type II toxin-antitoxin system HicB family antitoxin [Bryobacterales bacterium]NUN03539.1 type II toxin-antitoxin system HicB family antitoxin [Bryobacteraceae bacterium]